jgi:cytochrome c-type biogenesis protein CcmE
MDRLDEELAKAVEDSEQATEAADGGEQPPAVARPAEAPASPRRSLGLLAALLVMSGGILALVMTGSDDGVVYGRGVDELGSTPENGDRKVRVQGTLVKQSLQRRDQPCEYKFRMQKNGKVIEVRYPQCVVPDTFRDVPGMDVDVTAEGRMTGDGYFLASNIMAKCPSKYDMKQRAQSGEQAPHEAIVPAGKPATRAN